MDNYTNIVLNIPHGKEVDTTWLNLHGGIVLSVAEGRFLDKFFTTLSGNHVDIGTYFGGSAILAALAKPAGRVYSIDSQNTYHWRIGIVTPEKVQENITYFGVGDKISLIKSNSNPWPLNGVEIQSVFIDGDESDHLHAGGVLNDWLNAKCRATEYIIFHDCRALYPGVMRTFRKAKKDPNWKLIYEIDSIRIFRHDTPT